MSYETIIYEVEDRVATITLNRPERLNAISLTMINELNEVYQAAEADPDVPPDGIGTSGGDEIRLVEGPSELYIRILKQVLGPIIVCSTRLPPVSRKLQN